MSSALQQLGQTQQRLLQQLQRARDGLSIEALAAALGISRNAVRQHLTALLAQGLVARGAAAPTGGRPEQRYALTEAGTELFPRRYVQLAADLLGEIGQTLGEAQLQALLMRLGDRVGTQLAEKLRALPAAERCAAIAKAMSELGYDAEARIVDGVSEIRAGNCVFHHLAQQHPAVCRFDLAFLARAGEHRIEHAECMVRGGNVCRFRFLPGSGIDPKA